MLSRSKLQKIVRVLTMGRKGGYYAVRTGRRTGVFRTWYEYYFTLQLERLQNTRPRCRCLFRVKKLTLGVLIFVIIEVDYVATNFCF